MTSATHLLPPAVDAPAVRRSHFVRSFVSALVASALAVGVVAGVALLSHGARYEGRVLPGVRVGIVDLSGLTPGAASATLAAVYRGYGDGRIVIRTSAGEAGVPFADFARRPDTDAMVAEAMAAGREGSDLDRAIETVRIALRGRTLEPRLTLDEDALARSVAGALGRFRTHPLDATIAMRDGAIEITRARAGRAFDVDAVQTVALDAVRRLDAPAAVVIPVPAVAVLPARGDAAIRQAAAAAARMRQTVVVTDGRTDWSIDPAIVGSWIDFRPLADRTVVPVVDHDAIAGALGPIEKAVARRAVSATFLVGKSGVAVGVMPSRDGRRLDRAGTAAAIDAALAERLAGGPDGPVAAVVVAVEPELTTAEAEKIAPRMSLLGSWKTWFPIGERNYWGANIWLPARFINGTVLNPGQTFEWWRVVGPVTRARGFGPGGFIAGDHTEPTGALGGGMCSSSTTLWNAALRAGLQMGLRTNHVYYIDRYPLGLDATVQLGSNRRTITFTNDMRHPIYIRGYRLVGSGGRGYVVYEIWGIPDGRRVEIGRPVLTNVRRADTHVRDDPSLPAGVRKQVEWPANGMDVTVTRVVRDRDGHVIHRDTIRSHYRLWDGLILVGV